MSVPPPGGAPAGSTAAPPRTRLVALGLALVALGWAALAADLALAASGLQAGSLVAVLSLKNDVATLAEMLIVTGLGLAILGGLREGFGALNRFFEAALQRAAAPRPSPMPAPMPAPMPEPPPVELDEGFAPQRRAAPERASERAVERAVPPGPASALARNYQILPDGSVEVDTLLGTRVFASMDEARDFIR